MMPVRSRQRSDARLRADLAELLTPAPRTHLPVFLWRWRYEVAVMTTIIAAVTVLVWALGGEWGIITASVMAGV